MCNMGGQFRTWIPYTWQGYRSDFVPATYITDVGGIPSG